MKRIIAMLAAAVAVTAMTVPADAQGLGGLFNKAKKAGKKVENVLKGNQADAKNAEPAAATTVELGDGMSISNPLSSAIEITPVGLYGVSTSENYGECYLVLRVKMLEPVAKANFGSVGYERMLAVDEAGNMHEVKDGGSYPMNTPEGIAVTIKLDQKGLMFTGVKKSMKTMQMVKVGVYVSANQRGYVTIKNIPIKWDEQPD